MALNALYDQLWVYYPDASGFQPVLHLVGKEVTDGKLRRQWNQAQTPYQRLVNSGTLAPQQQERLVALYARTNPRQLRETIYYAVERLWQLPNPAITTNRKKAALLR